MNTAAFLNPRNPSRDELKLWAASAGGMPIEDFELYLMAAGSNDDLVVTFAADELSPKHDFFLHALYSFVGDLSCGRPAEKWSAASLKRINQVLALIPQEASGAILEWSRKVRLLLSGELNYDPRDWFDFDVR